MVFEFVALENTNVKAVIGLYSYILWYLPVAIDQATFLILICWDLKSSFREKIPSGINTKNLHHASHPYKFLKPMDETQEVIVKKNPKWKRRCIMQGDNWWRVISGGQENSETKIHDRNRLGSIWITVTKLSELSETRNSSRHGP